MMQDFDTFMSTQEDHALPCSKSGMDEHENIVISCYICNMLKHNYYLNNYESMSRAEIIADIRLHIMHKRVEKMNEYFSWINLEQTDYHA